MKVRLTIEVTRRRPWRAPEPESPPEFEHRDTEAYVEGAPRPAYPLGFIPAEE